MRSSPVPTLAPDESTLISDAAALRLQDAVPSAAAEAIRAAFAPHLPRLRELGRAVEIRWANDAIPPAGGKTIDLVICDGKLRTSLAEILRRAPPPLLLARRDEHLPEAWELGVAARLVSAGSLFPDSLTVETIRVAGRDELARAGERMAELARSVGASSSAVEILSDVVYELGVNAILDAPVDSAQRPKYAHRRQEVTQVDSEDACAFRYATDGQRMFVAVTDRFGRLTAAPIARTLEGIDARAKLHTSGGGAGLGLRRLLEESDLFAARVVPGRLTEVLSVLGLGSQRRRRHLPKSILYREERGSHGGR